MPSPDLDEIFHAEARFEFLYASEYYRSVSPELARKFVGVAHESRHPDYWVYRLDEPGRK
ncbi:hypothetical protein [uncultured Meiothermus sp.]|jgi:hypothetical protein|uniref:hypothetical protein n=1 Tax=uncultured Meiothermus sp. TaxID=157471 RepID=UPI002607F1F4|nr:hypothetical protein [uncultured Meiothermus sp.]